MTVPGVGFGMRWMTAPLHTGQCVGRRGGPEASAMSSSVGGAEAAHKSRSRPDGHASDTVEYPCRARQIAVADDVVSEKPKASCGPSASSPRARGYRRGPCSGRPFAGGRADAPGQPAATHAAAHALVNALMVRGLRPPVVVSALESPLLETV